MTNPNNKKSHIIVAGKGGGTQVQADWSQSDSTAADYIKNKPTGLSNEWWGTQAEYDLIDPKDPDTVYHIEGNSVDWDDVTDKPSFATVATSGDYDDLTNKPTIPTVNNATITLTQGGVTKGSFTLNQSGNDTIALDAGGAGGTADIPEEELNTITIYNESGATTFTKWEWTGGPVVSEIWNNGIKQTATVASPFTVETGVNRYLLTVPAGGQQSIAAGLELNDKYGTYWVYAHNGYNTPMSGDYSNGNCNCVLNLMTGTEKYNLGNGCSGVTFWFPDNNVQQVDVSSSNTFVFFDTTFNNIAFFPGYSWVDYNDIHCTIYVPANRRYEIMDILTQQITGTEYWMWEGHIQGYDNLLMSDDYKYKMVNNPTFTQEQANWAETNRYNSTFIKNKPIIQTLPGYNTEQLTFTLANNTTVTLNVYVQPDPDYFYVEDLSGNSNTLRINTDWNAPSFEVFKSTDQINWTSMGYTSGYGLEAAIPANGKIYLKALTKSWYDPWDGGNKINCDSNFKVGGNIMSLLAGDTYQVAKMSSYQWPLADLFRSSTTLINASALELPNDTVNGCYERMFLECTNLTAAPALPATTIAEGCYGSMFNGCTSLVTPPVMSATTLVGNCCYSMFAGCTSLTASPVLLATTLTEGCYGGMFDGCTSLATVTTYANDNSATNCTGGWLNNVAQSGDFYNLGSATYTADSADGIPTGWTEHNSL